MPSSLTGETGKYFNTAPQNKKHTRKDLTLECPLGTTYMGSEDLLGSTLSEHLLISHFPLIILTGRNGI